MDYRTTIETLFGLLSQANAGDCVECREEWQRADDASQRSGLYGHLRNAIVAIAGEEIVEYWAETNELIFALANRLPREQRISLQELRYFGSVARCLEERSRSAERKTAKQLRAKRRLLVAQIAIESKQLRANASELHSQHAANDNANPEYIEALETLMHSIDTIRRFH